MEVGDKKIVSATMGKKAAGVYTNVVNHCELTLKDGTKLSAFVKMKASDPLSDHLNKKLKLHREAEFYNYLKREKVDFEHCKFPGVYVAVPDENTGRFILLMEYIDGTVNTFKAFGEW